MTNPNETKTPEVIADSVEALKKIVADKLPEAFGEAVGLLRKIVECEITAESFGGHEALEAAEGFFGRIGKDGWTPEPKTTEELNAEIELSRSAEKITSDQARAASMCLLMEGDDAMLANRVLSQGSDPASLEYLLKGTISSNVRAAHYEGPGVFGPGCPEREHYLTLCAVSADESQNTGDLRGRVLQFADALLTLGGIKDDSDLVDDHEQEAVVNTIGAEELKKIMDLKHVLVSVDGVSMRSYTTDRGFAQAYWEGEHYACVLGEHPIEGPFIAVGTDARRYGKKLEEIGIKVNKKITDFFGIISDERVADIFEQANAQA